MIEGVAVKSLVTHSDERGFFREVIRVTDDFFREGFGQWSHSVIYQGAAKAWHVHERQIDWWYVASGVLKVALYDGRRGSTTHGLTQEFILGDCQPAIALKVPAGVAHGCRAISGPVHLFYVTSQVYDPTDEGRIPHGDSTIGYDWTAGPPIK